MSKNIIIEQDGVAQNLTVDKLRAAGVGGQSVDYIPAEGRGLATINVYRNGTYQAENAGVYGFDVIHVGITGRGGPGYTLGEVKEPTDRAEMIAISEGGKAAQMTARRLKTDLQGGGTCEWVAEVDTQLMSKNVARNGSFSAAGEGYYGYSQAVVDVEDGGGGSGGGGGDDEPFDPDDLPNSIVAAPLKITYADGEAIILVDGDVKAYVETPNPYGGTDRRLWTHPRYPGGIVPVSEVSYSPTVAAYPGDVHTAISALIQNGVAYSGGGIAKAHWISEYIVIEGGVVAFAIDDPNYNWRVNLIVAGPNPFRVKLYDETATGEYNERYRDASAYTYDGKTVYYSMENAPMDTEGAPVSVPVNDGSLSGYFREAAWTVIYGTILDENMEVNVSWQRPLDGQTLSTIFRIFVSPTGLPGGEVISEGGTQSGN